MSQSSLPEHTREFLFREGTWHLPGEDTACEGAAFHSPRPLFVKDTRLVLEEWWGENPEREFWVWAPQAWLCGTCRDNLAILLQMLYATNGELDWAIRREFGNALRAHANRGWEWFTTHRPADEPVPPTKG